MRPTAVSGIDPAVRALIDWAASNRLAQIALSERAGLSRNSVHRWGRGRNDPTISALRAALNAADLDLVVVPKQRGNRVDTPATSCKAMVP
jgi:DNA-binding phage protein